MTNGSLSAEAVSACWHALDVPTRGPPANVVRDGSSGQTSGVTVSEKSPLKVALSPSTKM